MISNKQKQTSLSRVSMRTGMKQVCIAVLLMLWTVSSHAAQLFRYIDQETGNPVMSHMIPADMARYGYDIVDSHGNLIERIKPQLSDEDYLAKLEHDAMVRECKKTHSRVTKLYQFESDIDYTEAKNLQSADQSISNSKANLAVVTSQRQEFETQAAQLDIAGQPIPNALLDNIQRAKTQEQNLEDEIEKRYGQKIEYRSTHEYERRVFALQNCEQGLPEKPSTTKEAVAVNQEK